MSFVADVFDVTLVDPKTNDAFAFTTLTDANIEFSLETNDIRGGQGNTLLGVLHSNRDININLTDTSFRYDWVAKQLGTDVTTGEGVAYAKPKNYEVVDSGSSSPSITLDNEPVKENSGLAIYTSDGKKIDGATVTGKEVDLSGATPTVKSGEVVEVRTYKYKTSAETEKIDFDMDKFPKGVTAILETVEIKGDETITHTIQYQFDNAVPDGNLTINTSSSREASTSEFALRVIKPENSTKVGQALRIPYGNTPS